MAMRAFEVYVNDRKICLAGIGEAGVLSAIVNWVAGSSGEDLFLSVSGLINPASEHVSWVQQKPFAVGDEMKVRVVEVESVDEPRRSTSEEAAKAIEDQKDYARKLAKRLGIGLESER
ncbi:MAG TPA: hypothetical protein VND65_11860 [Candidatus Binatia bacterium]|nr:hypothetical protein [Candidatus Binatia bacterium]